MEGTQFAAGRRDKTQKYYIYQILLVSRVPLFAEDGTRPLFTIAILSDASGGSIPILTQPEENILFALFLLIHVESCNGKSELAVKKRRHTCLLVLCDVRRLSTQH